MLVLALTLFGFADDWPQFRGPLGTGVTSEKDAPLEWGPDKNIRWKAPLPGNANSSPIVSKGRVFVTAAEDQGHRRSLLCFDRKTGALLWTRTVDYPGIEPTQKDNPYCGSTPCADGERVVVWHSSAGLHCYDFEGKSLWSRDLGKFDHMWGYGGSPILRGDRVFLNAGPGDRTFLTALDKRTGETLWKAEESGGKSKEWIGSWCTPVVAKIQGKEEILIGYPGAVKAFDPATGKVFWSCAGLGKLVYADIALGDGVGVATSEDEGGESIGFRLGGSGDVTGTHLLWHRPRPLEVGTGQIVEGHLWTIDNDGFLRSTEAATGKEIRKERSPCQAAWSSMIRAGDRIYVTGRSGDTLVFAPDVKKFSALGINRLGEPTNATPAISDGEIFIRTTKSLYCIGQK